MKPILFSTAMVQAIMHGKKTMTRRAKGLEGLTDYQFKGLIELDDIYYAVFYNDDDQVLVKPKYQPGEIMWVRESVCDFSTPSEASFLYKADGCTPRDGRKWKPSIHMPKVAARFFLEVTSVKCERLGDISEDDAISEGVIEYEDGSFKNYFTKKGLRETDGVDILLAKGSFQSLWHSINKEWNPDKWVWVYTFKKVNKKFAYAKNNQHA